jgi:hypothetical protein
MDRSTRMCFRWAETPSTFWGNGGQRPGESQGGTSGRGLGRFESFLVHQVLSGAT